MVCGRFFRPQKTSLFEYRIHEVRRLNEQVKRNINRFPEDFMFQLTREEAVAIRTIFNQYVNTDMGSNGIAKYLDNLDYEDKHYKRRKADLENRLSRTYDKIEETENALVEAKAKKRSILAEKVCGDNIYKALIFFDKMYEPMNEAERREFLTQFIEKVEIYEEEQENGQWLKSIEFKLPIISKDMKISLDNGSQIETVVLLSRTSA